MKLAVDSFTYIYCLKKTSGAKAGESYPRQGLECPSVWQHKGTGSVMKPAHAAWSRVKVRSNATELQMSG